MIRPPLEVADIVRTYGAAFVKRHGRWLTALHLKVLRAIVACRTAALGGHVEQCDSCRQRAISYNSCLNRHCPKCQAAARQTWLAERSAELLPVPYYHVVFTLPHVLAPLAVQNKALVYGLLFRAAAETLLEIAADPHHLGAKIGFLAVLHTWGQTLRHHPHLHCVVPGGGLSPDHRRWIRCGHKFFLPVKVLAVVFPWKVPRCARTSVSQTQAHSRRTTDPSTIAASLCRSTAHRCPARLGRICQATLRRTFASLGLSLSLYPSHRHRQLPLSFYGQRQGHLSLARLCPWIPKSDHDSGGR